MKKKLTIASLQAAAKSATTKLDKFNTTREALATLHMAVYLLCFDFADATTPEEVAANMKADQYASDRLWLALAAIETLEKILGVRA